MGPAAEYDVDPDLVKGLLLDQHPDLADRSACGASDAIDEPTWLRARGRALVLAIAYLAAADHDPIIGEVGRRTLAAVLE